MASPSYSLRDLVVPRASPIGSPLGSSNPSEFLNGSFGIYLGESHTDDPFSSSTPSSEQSFFFSGEGMDFSALLRASDPGEVAGLQVEVSSNDYTITFFNPMLVSDPKQQKTALEAISNSLLKSLKTPPQSLIRAHIARLVRFATESPFESIRTHFTHFLEQIQPELRTLGINVPKATLSPSRFFQPHQLIPLDTKSKDEQDIFRQAFLSFGRVTHMLRIFVWHPIYYDSFNALYNFVMRVQSGPLPRHVRNYIAILSAARFRCAYLVDDQERDFLRNKGDPVWLHGSHYSPKKLQALQQLNALLAFQPWKVGKEHIEALTKGSGEDSWTIAELVQAIVIMSTFHALAGICWGTGVFFEVDSSQYAEPTMNGDSSLPITFTPDAEDDMTEDLVMRMKKGFSGTKMAEMSMSGKLEMFAAAEKNSPTHGSVKPSTAKDPSGNPASQPTGQDAFVANGLAVEQKFCPGFQGLNHVDFDMSKNEIFNIADFGWGTQGFSLVKRYYNEAAPLLDEHFKTIRGLTYQRFAGQAVDTEPFRMAIWFYVHRVCGIFHDDFDYQRVNQLVHQKTKSYVKKVAIEPFMISSADLNLGMQFMPEEKAHISFLAAESRKQAELLYGLRAVSKYLSSK